MRRARSTATPTTRVLRRPRALRPFLYRERNIATSALHAHTNSARPTSSSRSPSFPLSRAEHCEERAPRPQQQRAPYIFLALYVLSSIVYATLSISRCCSSFPRVLPPAPFLPRSFPPSTPLPSSPPPLSLSLSLPSLSLSPFPLSPPLSLRPSALPRVRSVPINPSFASSPRAPSNAPASKTRPRLLRPEKEREGERARVEGARARARTRTAANVAARRYIFFRTSKKKLNCGATWMRQDDWAGGRREGQAGRAGS